jgi:uncharacterized membrane protein
MITQFLPTTARRPSPYLEGSDPRGTAAGLLDPSATNRTATSQDPLPKAARSLVVPLIAIAALVFFVGSTIRHHIFRSGALDLGFFDQLVYLVSVGKPPMSTVIPLHLLADHGAFILYAVAPLYRICPDVHVLLFLQAIALAAGAYPIFKLARLSNLTIGQSRALSIAYLLYPVLLAANEFDFHPEVFAIPAILFAVLSAQRRNMPAFLLALVVAAGGKEVISLTIVAMGFWLLFFKNRSLYGMTAMILGSAWFLIATRWMIPHFGGGREASGVRFYAYLGSSVPQIIATLALHPSRWLIQFLRPKALVYLAILFGPVLWGLHPRHLLPLIGALPTLALNLLARGDPWHDLTYPFSQYSLLIVPFIALALIDGVASNKTLLRNPRSIITWSIALILLGGAARLMRVNVTPTTDAHHEDVRRAMALVHGDGGVLTTHEIVPHLSHRQLIQYISPAEAMFPMGRFDYILVNFNDASIQNARPLTNQLIASALATGDFSTALDCDQILLLTRVRVPASPK